MVRGVGGSSAAAELARLAQWQSPSAEPISRDEHEQRLEKARRLTRNSGAQVLLIGAGHSLRYFTGVAWAPSERLVAMLLPADGHPVVIGPRFESGPLADALMIEATISTWEEHEDPIALVEQTLRDWNCNTLAVDPQLPFTFVHEIGRRIRLQHAAPIVDQCRMLKSANEIALMQKAKAMTLEVQRSAALILREGITTTEVHRFLDEAHRAVGAEGSSFRIVQFGLSTTYMHSNPAALALNEGDVVLIDTGCTVEGYNSDITRTYVFGEPTIEQRRVWEIEHEAQRVAFEAAKPGVPCEEVDWAARKFLESHGFGPGYELPGLPHRTGHGIGLSLHEATYLVRGNTTPLATGMCFSNEPMIVIPGKFGIRLEDHVHMTGEGAAWFTNPPPSIDDPLASPG